MGWCSEDIPSPAAISDDLSASSQPPPPDLAGGWGVRGRDSREDIFRLCELAITTAIVSVLYRVGERVCAATDVTRVWTRWDHKRDVEDRRQSAKRRPSSTRPRVKSMSV